MLEEIEQLKENHERKEGIKAKKQETWKNKRELKENEKLDPLA